MALRRNPTRTALCVIKTIVSDDTGLAQRFSLLALLANNSQATRVSHGSCVLEEGGRGEEQANLSDSPLKTMSRMRLVDSTE